MQRYSMDTGPFGNGYSAEPDEFGGWVKADESEEKISHLESQLAEARAEIERLMAANAKNIEAMNTWEELYDKKCARIAELEADVVWAVRHAATCTVEPAESLYGHPSIEVPCNGTPADILRAVREARNGVS